MTRVSTFSFQSCRITKSRVNLLLGPDHARPASLVRRARSGSAAIGRKGAFPVPSGSLLALPPALSLPPSATATAIVSPLPPAPLSTSARFELAGPSVCDAKRLNDGRNTSPSELPVPSDATLDSRDGSSRGEFPNDPLSSP